MIVVTAPTSRIGSQLIPLLLAGGQRVRVIARDPAKLSGDTRDRVEVLQGSIDDPAVLDTAFAGAHALFWLVPFPFSAGDVDAHYRRFMRPAADAVTAQGVRRVVAISGLYARSLARATGQTSLAIAGEQPLLHTGVDYRALWCASFMENLLQQVPAIAQQGTFYGQARPDQPLPLVAIRDIAALAAQLLLDETWAGQGGVAVMGPEDQSQNDMAGVMTEVLGRPVRYQHLPPEAFKAQFLQAGASPSVAQWLIDMFTAAQSDPHGGESRTPANTTPTSFRQWCTEVLKPAVQSA
jgi:uncharacterized protein YbjT (DUF2867 family)